MGRYLALLALLLAALLAASCSQAEAARIINHDISVAIDPTIHGLSGQDRLTLSGEGGLSFLLHKGLEVRRVVSGAGRPLKFAREGESGGLTAWRIFSPTPVVVIDYGGSIYEPPRDSSSARSLRANSELSSG